MTARVNLNDYIERKRAEHSIEIELPDGSTVTLPPVELWSDAAQAANKAGDKERFGQLLLGEEAWASFVAAGGSFAVLNGIFIDQQARED